MSLKGFEFLHIEDNEHISTIKFNRPDKLNAINSKMSLEIHEALDIVSNNKYCRALIITGEGRGFCSGADVGESLGMNLSQAGNPRANDHITDLGSHIRQINQPVITAINGIAAGIGLTIALSSDIRVASEESSFSCIFIKRSLVPDGGSSYILTKLLGQGIAMEMALTGNIYGAKWALQKGLVNSIVDPGKLIVAANEIAVNIAENPPMCVRATKKLMYSYDMEIPKIVGLENSANMSFLQSNDMKEAIKSFMEKRPPVFHDN